MKQQKKSYEFKQGLELTCPGYQVEAAGYSLNDFKIGMRCIFLVNNATGEVRVLAPEPKEAAGMIYTDEFTTKDEAREYRERARKVFNAAGFTIEENEELWSVVIESTQPDIIVRLKKLIYANQE